MITAKGLDNQTYATVITDEKGRSVTICPSRIPSDYFSPRDLMQAALAGCLSMTLRRELSDAGIDFTDVEVDVDMPQANETYELHICVRIESTDDAGRIETVKKHAVENCFIKNLLASGLKIVEDPAPVRTGSDPDSDRCCG